jgi:hypothetical protein
MATEPRSPYARVATHPRSDERSYGGVAPSSFLEGRSRGEGVRSDGGRWPREVLQQKWGSAPPYRFPPPASREVADLGAYYEQLTGRPYTARMGGLMTAVLRVHGSAARKVLEEQYRAGGLDNLLARARLADPVADQPVPPKADHKRRQPAPEPADIAEWLSGPVWEGPGRREAGPGLARPSGRLR